MIKKSIRSEIADVYFKQDFSFLPHTILLFFISPSFTKRNNRNRSFLPYFTNFAYFSPAKIFIVERKSIYCLSTGLFVSTALYIRSKKFQASVPFLYTYSSVCFHMTFSCKVWSQINHNFSFGNSIIRPVARQKLLMLLTHE